MKGEYREKVWELQKEVETISKPISEQKFSLAIGMLRGRKEIEKHRSRIASGGKLRSRTYFSRDYLVPLGGYHYLRIDRNQDGSLSMWLYDSRNPHELGISTLLAYRFQPVIVEKLELLKSFLS